ncbi:hypothetical protein [Hugenholtzia roseola]|uniref:hypothetical protein n=1 Tax=Hugenholtzia roseola TaxID=1002 RepID=UPI00047EC1BB|nr:hypothetical protein [Hugenholtzia roseola]
MMKQNLYRQSIEKSEEKKAALCKKREAFATASDSKKSGFYLRSLIPTSICEANACRLSSRAYFMRKYKHKFRFTKRKAV